MQIADGMDLALDIGNTHIKYGIFRGDHLFASGIFSSVSHQRLLAFAAFHRVKNLIISSVRQENPVNLLRARKYFHTVMELSASTPLPINITYQSKETLGKDRIAAAVGASCLFPDREKLVIDAGSAITIDFVSHQNEFLGGNISPGLHMRFRALHHYTNKLPLVTKQNQVPLLGTHTQEAIASGVQNGIVFELNHYIEKFKARHPKIAIIITGGDMKFFDNKLKYPIFAESNLVLIGLSKILKFNLYAH